MKKTSKGLLFSYLRQEFIQMSTGFILGEAYNFFKRRDNFG
jgi:hypothetical protein